MNKKTSTRQLFLTYLHQLEQLGVDRLYWDLPAPGQVKNKPRAASKDKVKALAVVESRVNICVQCPLHQGRTQAVPGAGNPNADLVFVGEAPGYEEDKQGRPFVGKAGHLLTKIIEAMQLTREDVFICNVIKCRPPENRNPEPEEIITCQPYLVEQLRIIQPKVICAMGKFAAQTLIGTTTSITRLRGSWYEYQGIPLMPTFHPAYLLRYPEKKRLVWQDIQQVMARLGIPV
jgi:uracil-DNA glycosylase